MCFVLYDKLNVSQRGFSIEAGINDLPWKTPTSLFEDYKSIIEFVKTENFIPVINSVLYLSPKAGVEIFHKS